MYFANCDMPMYLYAHLYSFTSFFSDKWVLVEVIPREKKMPIKKKTKHAYFISLFLKRVSILSKKKYVPAF